VILATFSAHQWLTYSGPLVTVPQTRTVEGYVCSIPVIRTFSNSKALQTTVSFDFCTTRINTQSIAFYQANKIKLNAYENSKQPLKVIRAGSRWQLQVKLKPIHGRLNPNGFNYEKWLFSEGFIATGYVKVWNDSSNITSFLATYHELRQQLYDSLNQIIPQGETKGVILALAMGERSQIERTQWDDIKNSGTAHLLAISGLHIGIAALWSYYLFLFIFSRCSLLTRRVPAQHLAGVMSLFAALSIALISGFEYPSQRALIMLCVFYLSRWSARHLSLGNVLALSVFIITIIQPFSVLSTSFWLSVFAVGVITLLLYYRQEIKGRHHRFKNWLRINWYLYLGLIPISWFVFDNVSVVGIVANLILIPLTSFVTTPIVYIGLATLVFSETIASIVFYLADYAVLATLFIQTLLAKYNQTLAIPAITTGLFILFSLAVFLQLLPRGLPGKSLVYPILLIGLLRLNITNPEPTIKMVVFDIGQGLAIHIAVKDKHLLYDTGYGSGDYSMASGTLLPYFKGQGINDLETLVISHNDSDHAGGLKTILDGLTVNHLFAGEMSLFERQGIFSNRDVNNIPALQNCHSANVWQWHGVTFKFLPHLSKQQRKGNNASCVLLIETATTSILIPGDIEKKAEKQLLRDGLKVVDLLIAPHHGSLTSSTPEFVNQLKPKIAIFSAGYANQWSFPKREVLRRYERFASQLMTTFETGAITITENGEGALKITTQRGDFPHFWQSPQ